ncbi:MAG TPA: hypothetical protein VN229_05505 [Terriglobales bacterium]|nr:hypothetical protein [Terriglobales bacterium]
MSTEVSTIRADNAANDQYAALWVGALQRAERRQLDACHATLLGWIMALPVGIDPATAATAVISHQQRAGEAVLSPQLMALLQNVASYPAHRLLRAGTRRRLRAVVH